MTPTSKHSPAPGGRRSMAERRVRERRILALGIALSVLAHAGVILLVGEWLDRAPSPAAPRATPVVVEPPRGMRAIDIRVEPAVDVAPVQTPTPREQEERQDTRRERVVAAEPAADSARADDRTAADRLSPRLVDPRLWQPMILIPREPTLADVEARVGAALELLSDSALAEADAAIRARDWTVADASGGKWGISPGKIHLGNLTLPLPIWFPEDPEAVARQAQWYELDQQLERTRILESFEERVRAIRERRERERAEARGGG